MRLSHVPQYTIHNGNMHIDDHDDAVDDDHHHYREHDNHDFTMINNDNNVHMIP